MPEHGQSCSSCSALCFCAAKHGLLVELSDGMESLQPAITTCSYPGNLSNCKPAFQVQGLSVSGSGGHSCNPYAAFRSKLRVGTLLFNTLHPKRSGRHILKSQHPQVYTPHHGPLARSLIWNPYMPCVDHHRNENDAKNLQVPAPMSPLWALARPPKLPTFQPKRPPSSGYRTLTRGAGW